MKPERPHSPSQLLTINDAAALLKVSPKTVRRLIKSGELPVVRIGRLVRIRPEDAADLIARKRSSL